MSVIKWEKDKNEWVGSVFDVPLYIIKLFPVNHRFGSTLGVWIDTPPTSLHELARVTPSHPNPAQALKTFAEEHFTNELQPHLAEVLRSIRVKDGEPPAPTADPEPIILKFPGVAV